VHAFVQLYYPLVVTNTPEHVGYVTRISQYQIVFRYLFVVFMHVYMLALILFFAQERQLFSYLYQCSLFYCYMQDVTQHVLFQL